MLPRLSAGREHTFGERENSAMRAAKGFRIGNGCRPPAFAAVILLAVFVFCFIRISLLPTGQAGRETPAPSGSFHRQNGDTNSAGQAATRTKGAARLLRGSEVTRRPRYDETTARRREAHKPEAGPVGNPGRVTPLSRNASEVVGLEISRAFDNHTRYRLTSNIRHIRRIIRRHAEKIKLVKRLVYKYLSRMGGSIWKKQIRQGTEQASFPTRN
jgi:hypothetical protein